MPEPQTPIVRAAVDALLHWERGIEQGYDMDCAQYDMLAAVKHATDPWPNG